MTCIPGASMELGSGEPVSCDLLTVRRCLVVAGAEVSGTVQSDGVTLQGDGSAASKLAIKAVQHDDTLAGSGTAAAPMSRRMKDGFYYGDDFCTGYTCLASTGGLGPGTVNLTPAPAGHPGVLRQTVTSAITPDKSNVLPNALGPFGVTGAIKPGGGAMTCEILTMSTSVQDGVDQWSDRWGTGNVTASTDSSTGIYFEADRATYGDNSVRLCTAEGGVRTKTNLGVAQAAATWERWAWVCNAAVTSVQAFKDGVAVGLPNTTNLPTSNDFATLWFQLLKTLGGATRVVDRDYFEIYQALAR